MYHSSTHCWKMLLQFRLKPSEKKGLWYTHGFYCCISLASCCQRPTKIDWWATHQFQQTGSCSSGCFVPNFQAKHNQSSQCLSIIRSAFYMTVHFICVTCPGKKWSIIDKDGAPSNHFTHHYPFLPLGVSAYTCMHMVYAVNYVCACLIKSPLVPLILQSFPMTPFSLKASDACHVGFWLMDSRWHSWALALQLLVFSYVLPTAIILFFWFIARNVALQHLCRCQLL